MRHLHSLHGFYFFQHRYLPGGSCESAWVNMSSRTEAVKVCLRVRPLLGVEKNAGQTLQTASSAQNEVTCATNIANAAALEAGKRFTFDYVMGPERGQQDMHEQCVSPLLQGFLEGYNATILAYGQTGSGKTYTMGTASSHNVSEQNLGIVPRVVRQMFAHLAAKSEQGNGSYSVKVSFLEVHNEKVHVSYINRCSRVLLFVHAVSCSVAFVMAHLG